MAGTSSSSAIATVSSVPAWSWINAFASESRFSVSKRINFVSRGVGGSEASKTLKTWKAGKYRPKATKEAVRGVESSRPIGPHSQVQNIAETMTAKGDIPALPPKTIGSITLLVNTSRKQYRPRVRIGAVHVVEMATERTSGKKADIHSPTYGRNRNTRVRTAQSKAFGIPISESPIASTTA